MELREKKRIAIVAYGLVAVVASLPLACEYVMRGGDILLWLSRVEEIVQMWKTGNLCLFSSVEIMQPYGNQSSAVNSNLLFFFPALLRTCGWTITSAYRLYLLLLQIVTVLGVRAFFREAVQDEWTAYIGTVLFITCPYRIYICYDVADLGAAAAWTFVAVYAWGVMRICRSGWKWTAVFVTLLATAGIAYSDVVVFVIASGLSLLYCLYAKQWKALVVYAGGCVLSAPALIYFVKYLVRGNLNGYEISLGSIVPNGYTPGQIFSSFAYRDHLPGVGLGLLCAIAVLCWLKVTGDMTGQHKNGKFAVVTGILMFFCGTVYFPWDMVQRVAGMTLRFVSLIFYPNVFVGFGCLLISIPAACAVGQLRKQKNDFLRYGIPAVILIAGFGVAIWLCNTLTYVREPMFLLETIG